MNTNNSVMALATTFADRGDWTVEQQFVLQMGSSYLLAHGIGTPLQRDAVTTVEVPADGEYNLLVRTKNWTKHWSDGPTRRPSARTRSTGTGSGAARSLSKRASTPSRCTT